MHSIHYRTLF